MIAVITSFYNNYTTTPVMFSRYLEGLRSQSVPFILVGIDDRGSDKTIKLVTNSGLPVVILKNKKNIGLTRSLIRGIKWIKSNLDCNFVVSHDADDYSHIERFKTQVEYMQDNPNVDILNSAVRVCNTNGEVIATKPSLVLHKDICQTLVIRNIFYHSAVMMRRCIFDVVNYNKKHKRSQDYGLWIECLKNGFGFGGINKCLVTRCKHERSVGVYYKSDQRRTAKQIRNAYVNYLKGQVDHA